VTIEERVTHNEVRRWQNLPARIATNERRLAAYQATLAREEQMSPRDHRRCSDLRRQIKQAHRRIASMRSQL